MQVGGVTFHTPTGLLGNSIHIPKCQDYVRIFSPDYTSYTHNELTFTFVNSRFISVYSHRFLLIGKFPI